MKKEKVIVFQGGGQYFFWYMGVARYLLEHFDLTDVRVVGGSAGALAAVLMVCGVDVDVALECALRLCDEVGVWGRWLKFLGVWGDMVGLWLDRLLPENAADLCHNRVHILVSQLFGVKKVVSTFATKQELIDCLRASTHIPFFMDYRPFYWYQGWWCYDGCIGNITDEPYKVFAGDEQYDYHIFFYRDDDHQDYSINSLPTDKHTTANLAGHGYQYAHRMYTRKQPAGCRIPTPPPGL